MRTAISVVRKGAHPLLLAAYGLLLLVAFFPPVLYGANLTRSVEVDLSKGTTRPEVVDGIQGTYYELSPYVGANSVLFKPVTIRSGDNLTVNIDFRGDQRLEVTAKNGFYGNSEYLYVFVMSQPYSGGPSQTSNYPLVKLQGLQGKYYGVDRLPEAYTGCGSPNNACLAGSPWNPPSTNLTDSSFSFSGISITYTNIQILEGPSPITIDRLDNISVVAGDVRVVGGTEPKTALVVGMGSDPSSSLAESKNVTEVIETANIPLGAIFFIQLVNNKIPVNSSFSLGSSTIYPTITEPTLFKNNVVIPFETNSSPSAFKLFQAIHFGNVVITITPTDKNIKKVQLNIKVNNPASLGATHKEIDNILVNLGHRRGIPPHMLKGQVERESSFTPTAYRYEPLSVDLAYISTGQNLRTTNPYALYRLETSDNLAQGSDILDEDISPRSIYYILRDNIRRAIENMDKFVSALEIYNENDASKKWSNYSPARAKAIQENPDIINFTAQTPLAASFGYLQILYSTADKPMWWTGNVNGDRNPSLLFDTEYNVQNGNGSLILGTGYLRRIFVKPANPNLDINNPIFSSTSAIDEVFKRAFNYYNHGNISDDYSYGSSVMSSSKKYLPVSSGAIFK